MMVSLITIEIVSQFTNDEILNEEKYCLLNVSFLMEFATIICETFTLFPISLLKNSS